jgi:hypothetical protein
LPITAISVAFSAIILVLFFFLSNSQKPIVVENNDYLEVQNEVPPSETMEVDEFAELNNILEEFSKTHTYSARDDFMCVDMSTELWNIVKTSGYNAEICIGNVDEDISGETDLLNWLNRMDHAWVLIEKEPFTWLAAESTGGFLVFGEGKSEGYYEENDLYYQGLCFKTPGEYKNFAKVKEDAYKSCDSYDALVKYWNENIVGSIETKQTIEIQTEMNLLKEQCDDAMSKLEVYTQ